MAGAPAHRLPYLHHGSSPHTRGTSAGRARRPVARRFIPACAGNASRPPSHPPGTSVHPRIRGEHCSTEPRAESRPGSSPHTRGTGTRKANASTSGRFIPACAGNTMKAPSMCRPPLALTPARVRRAPSRINATGFRPYQTPASAPIAVRRSRCALIRGRRIF